ncbi:EpsG family protein [Gordonia terrae]
MEYCAFAVVLAVVGAALVAVAPIPVVTVCIIGILVLGRVEPALSGLVIVLLMASIFAWLNVGKEITGDWVWYSSHYTYLEQTPLLEYLGVRVGNITPDLTEPLYYSAARAISVLTGASIPALAVCVTAALYLSVGIAVVWFARTLTSSSVIIAVCTFSGMALGVTFTLSSQLVRQEIAAGFLCIAIVAAGRRVWILSCIFMVAAGLTHNSALVPASAIVVALLLMRLQRHAFVSCVVGTVAFASMGYVFLNRFGFSEYVGGDDGAISPLIFVFDFSLVVAFYLVAAKMGDLRASSVVRLIAFLIPLFYAFVFSVYSQPIPFLRLYFFIEILRTLIICYCVVMAMRHFGKFVVGAVVCVISFMYVDFRIARSPFEYGRDFLSSILYSPFFS